MSMSQSQAQEIIKLFNNGTSNQNVKITLTNSSGQPETTTLGFSIDQPNTLGQIGEALNPFQGIFGSGLANGIGDAWTAFITGGAYVDFNTSNTVLIDNGVVSPIRLTSSTLSGNEDLALSTIWAWNNIIPQIGNALNVYVSALYISGSGALVKVQLIPNMSVLSGYTVTVNGGNFAQSHTSSGVISEYTFFLKTGTLGSDVIDAANTVSVSSNQSSGTATSSDTTTTSYNTSSGTGTSTNTSSNTSTTTSTPSYLPTTLFGSTSNSQPTSSSSGNTSYSQPTSSSYGNTSYASTTPPASTGTSMTTYLIIGGVAIAGLLAFFLMDHKKGK